MTSPNTIIADLTAEVETLRKQRDELLSSFAKGGIHIIDRGFKRCGTEATPTLLIGFEENNWKARDFIYELILNANAKGGS